MKKTIKYVSCALGTILCVWSTSFMDIQAESEKISVAGKEYEFDEKSSYNFSDEEVEANGTREDIYGQLLINGDILENTEKDGMAAYGFDGADISFCYVNENDFLSSERDSKEEHIVKDDDKKVDQISLGEKMKKGALILQTSKDLENWVTAYTKTDLFSGGEIQNEEFYAPSDIQLTDGCYYRVIVAYETEQEVDPSKILAWKKKNYDYKKYAEVYEFYAYDANVALTEDTNDLRKNMGDKEKTEKSGYTDSTEIEEDNCHYGWDIGKFFVSGYLKETEDKDGNIIFLKNQDEKVSLWFDLLQDIDCLNEKKELSIAADDDAYDQDLETKKADFGRGALIIRYTDYENVKHEAEVYPNYLEADVVQGRDVKVQTFDEGDYEIALDYKIKRDKTKVLGKSVMPEYTYYRIYFQLSVRNEDSDVILKDLESGNKLSSNAIAENGFEMDLSKSRYLDVEIKREILDTENNKLEDDPKWNKTAKTGGAYKEEGIYLITGKNRYTKKESREIVYVGDNSILQDCVKKGMSLDEIQQMLTEEKERAEKATETETEMETQVQTEEETVESTQEKGMEANVSEEETTEISKEEGKKSNKVVIIAVVAAVVLVVVVLIMMNNKKKNKKRHSTYGIVGLDDEKKE